MLEEKNQFIDDEEVINDDDITTEEEGVEGESEEDLDPQKIKEEVAKLKKELKTQRAKMKHWREKYQKIAEFVQPPKKEEPEPDVVERLSKLEEVEQKREFGYRYGYSPEEVDKIFAFAKGEGKKPEEVVDDPFVQAAIDKIREKKKVENAIPFPSNSTLKVDGKSWDEMTPEEQKANYHKIWQKQ